MHVWCHSDNVPHSGLMSPDEIRWQTTETTTADDESVDWLSSYGT